MTADPTVLKLGGSVITDKARAETIDGASLERAADAIAAVLEDEGRAVDGSAAGGLVLVHGGGSFGHHHASDHGVSVANGTRDVDAVHAIHGAMKTLNGFVLRELLERDVPAVPLHPLSAAHRGRDGALSLPTGHVATALEEGFVPVLHGDVVVHRGAGATIVSGDELVVELARALEADRVGLCSTVPGVLDGTGEVVETIEDFDSVEAALGESAATDVTGGMAKKVRTLLDLDAPASVFGLEGLEAFLSGERPGTTID